MDSKLKCVFEYVDDGEGNAETSVGGNVSAVMQGFYHGMVWEIPAWWPDV